MDVHFVYQPRSGPRWLPDAEPRAGVACPVITWANGCAHVIGRRLTVEAARPREWWRTEAASAAGVLATLAQSVAWDENGTVSVVLPFGDEPDGTFRYSPAEAARWLYLHRAVALGGRDEFRDAEFVPDWARPRAADLAWARAGGPLRLPYREGQRAQFTAEVRREPRYNTDTREMEAYWLVVIRQLPGEYLTAREWAVTAPEAWGRPTVYGAEPAAETTDDTTIAERVP